MKVIDLLNKIATHESLPKKIKYRGDIYTLYIDESFINYEPECGDWLFNQYLYKLNDEIEIIEEDKPIEKIEIVETKEELKELEEMEYAKAGDLMITIINELIKNQNKIIRELKDKK